MVRLKAHYVVLSGPLLSFQFQYGTIKSLCLNFYIRMQRNFNSSMVRLKEYRDRQLSREHANFNSSMVRLKATYLAATGMALGNFNSSMVRLKVNSLSAIFMQSLNFNSSMVRLKDIGVIGSTSDMTFQFQYGTIKRESGLTQLLQFLYFNSSMVRLKDHHTI